MPTGASITYFILTFVTLFILYLQYEIINFGYRDVLMWWRLISGVYGIILLALGIAVLIVEMSQIEDICN